MVAVLSLSMAFVAFAAEGTLEDPHAITSIEGPIDVTVPANGTVCYYADNGTTVPMYDLLDKEISVADSNVTLKIYAIGWDGTVAETPIEAINPRMYSGIVFELANATVADIATTLEFNYPLGSANNPYFVFPAEDGTIAVEVPAWGATYYTVVPGIVSDKMLDVSNVVEDVTSIEVIIDGVCTTYWTEDIVDGVITNAFDTVDAWMTGSVIIGVCGPMEDIEGTIALAAKPGTYENPYFVFPAEDGTIAVEVPAWGATYYTVVPGIVSDTMLDVSDVLESVTSIEVIIDGVCTTYWAEDIADGVIADAFDTVNAWTTGSVIIGVCGPMEDLEGTIALAAKPGTYENPEYLVLDENGEATVNAPAWGEKYYAVVPFAATGKVLDVSGIIEQAGAVTVIIDGVSTTYWAEDIAEDGIIEDAFDGVNMLTGSVTICVGAAMEDLEGTIALVAKTGTYENPNALVLNEEGEATVSVPAGETVYYWVVPAVAADKYLVLGDLGLTVSVDVDGTTTPYEVDEDGNIMNAFENVDAYFTGKVLVEFTNTTEEDIEGTVALGLIEVEEEPTDAPQTGVAAALLSVVAVLSGAYIVRRRNH